MARLSLWNRGLKGADYRYIDRTISEFINISGAAVYLHLYKGTYDSSGNPTDTASTDTASIGSGVTTVQDVLFLENRDRIYDPNVYEIRGIYNVGDSDFDMRQFGLFLTNDTVFLEVHFNDMISLIGRKIMTGDVIELPNKRDDYLLNGGPSINAYYSIEDASYASDGYSSTWFPHIWRLKCSPLTGGQEYQDLLNQPATNPLGYQSTATLGSLITTMATDLAIDEAVVNAAISSVPRRYFQTQQFYVCPGSELGVGYPWIFAGDGDPPNGAVLTGSGSLFPDAPTDGMYYLRTDYHPHVLFKFYNSRWMMQEMDYRQSEWSVANALIKSFINNNQTAIYGDGTSAPVKTNLSKAVKPRADF